jgi:hypothetical protein
VLFFIFLSAGLRTCPSRSCDGWVCGLGAVGVSLVFGLVRGTGAFAAVLPSFALVSGMSFAQHNRGFGHFFSASFSSRREAMVGGSLTRALAWVSVGLPSCLDRALANHTCGFLAC